MPTLQGIEYDDGVTVAGYKVKGTSRLQASTRETNVPPTLGDIQAAFGFASEAGSGFLGLLDPSGAGTSFYLCACDGVNWWSLSMATPPN